jgi:hypothetical protein
MEEALRVRQIVALIRGKDRKWAMARVVRCGVPTSDGLTSVAVELKVPNEAFWGVLTWSGV